MIGTVKCKHGFLLIKIRDIFCLYLRKKGEKFYVNLLKIAIKYVNVPKEKEKKEEEEGRKKGEKKIRRIRRKICFLNSW